MARKSAPKTKTKSAKTVSTKSGSVSVIADSITTLTIYSLLVALLLSIGVYATGMLEQIALAKNLATLTTAVLLFPFIVRAYYTMMFQVGPSRTGVRKLSASHAQGLFVFYVLLVFLLALFAFSRIWG